MGLAGMSHHPPPPLPCRGQKTTDPEKPSFPSSTPPHVSTRQRRVRDREPSSKLTADRILAASADYYAAPSTVEKKRREAESADSSSVHYRRSSVHIRRETPVLKPVPPIGSANRMRHRIRVPTRLSPPFPLSSSSIHPHSLAFLARRLRPRRCSSHECVSSKARASKVSAPLSSCRLEAATSATRPRDPHRMWAVSCFTYHAIFQAWDGMHHRRWKYIQPGRIEFDFEEGMIV